jgi:hypothetical protein
VKKHYLEIINDSIDWFRREVDDRIINLCLLDFGGEVFHHHGRKSELKPDQIKLLLENAQAIIRSFGFNSTEVQQLAGYVASDISHLQMHWPALNDMFEHIFYGQAFPPALSLQSDDVARLISLLPVKHYWDNSGVMYQRRHLESTFESAYLWQFKYEIEQRKPAEVKWREIEIPTNMSDVKAVEAKLNEFQTMLYRQGAEYFSLRDEDQRLYDLYGQLFDLLNWGATDPENIDSYLEVRDKPFEINLFYFPIVFQGIYYGIASLDLPSEFFATSPYAAEKLSRIIAKGKTFVNYYFPSLIMDAYNNRLFNRFSQTDLKSVAEVVNAVSIKVPFHFCYDRKQGHLYYFAFSPEYIGKRLKMKPVSPGLQPCSKELAGHLLALDPDFHLDQMNCLEQTILDNDLVFIFDVYFFPGKDKVLPVLESHLGVAENLLETLRDRHQRDLVETRSRLLDTFAHEEKTSLGLLIADLEDGLESDVAAQELRRMVRAKTIMRNRLLRKLNDANNGDRTEGAIRVDFQDLVTEFFHKAYRAWLKNRRFRPSYQRNRHPELRLTSASTRNDAEIFFAEIFKRYPEKDRACLEILRQSFIKLSPEASFQIEKLTLSMQEHAQIRLQEILYNLFCNFFLHVAPSPLTGHVECKMRFCVTASERGVIFKFSLSNSTATREHFQHEIKRLVMAGGEFKGLQIVHHLLSMQANGELHDMRISHENYSWQIEIERECRACIQNPMVDTRS